MIQTIRAPDFLRPLKNWLVWRLTPDEQKPRKVPFYTDGRPRGAHGTEADRAALVTYDEAVTAAARGGYTGVGFAPFADTGVVALDFDNVVTGGLVRPDVLSLCEGTYAELSPSGRGVRAFLRGKLPSKKDTRGEPFAVEIFGSNGFVTFTGRVLEDCVIWGHENTVAEITPAVEKMFQERFGEPEVSTGDDYLLSLAPKLGWTLDHAREALSGCDASAGRDYWLKCLMAMHHEFDGSDAAFEIVNAWSATGSSYVGRNDVWGRWRSFGRSPSSITARWLIKASDEARAAKQLAEIGDEDQSDVLLSRKLANLLAGRFLYEHGGRRWLMWHRGAWVNCSKSEEVAEAMSLGALILRYAGSDPKEVGKTIALAKRAMSATGIAAALKLAQSDPRIAVRPDDFDRDPELLNCRSGIIHLPSGELRPHDPTTRMSRQCPVEYIPGSEPPARWLEFLREISCNDGDWINYMQRACGYILSGHVREEVMFFWLGRGANGKSVLVNVLSRIMGGYAVSVPSGFLMKSQRDGDSATPSTAMLQGARLALANEVEAGSQFSAQVVKTVCSTEPIAARHLYGSSFSFLPTHKLVVRGNHKPRITDNDEGIWRRIHLVPFDRHFGPDEKDMSLEATLMAEAPAILAWLVRGATEYFSRGLRPAKRVADASATYRKDSDLLGQWVDDECEVGATFETVQTQAYSYYQSWCQRQGMRPLAKRSFTQGLTERGFGERQSGSGARQRYYTGLKLEFEL